MATRIWKGNDSSTPNDYSVAGNWDTAVPTASDTVIIPAGSASITAGLNQSSVELAEFTVQEGYTGTIGIRGASGAEPTYLQIDLANDSPCEFTLQNHAYVNIGTSDVDVTVFRAATGAQGDYGLCLQGTGIQTLSVHAGSVGLAHQRGDIGHCDDIQLHGSALLYRGQGADNSTATISGGTLVDAGGISTCNIYSGRFTSIEKAALTTLNCYGGRSVLSSVTTVTTVNMKKPSCSLDFSQNGNPRTVTTLNFEEGDIKFHPNVTITNFNHSTLAAVLTSRTMV